MACALTVTFSGVIREDDVCDRVGAFESTCFLQLENDRQINTPRIALIAIGFILNE